MVLKYFELLTQYNNVISTSINKVYERIVNQYNNIQGREEEISHQFASEINLHFLEEIEKNLNGKKLKGVEFKVYTYKKREENITGADLAGIIEINYEKNRICKAFLSQAKFCKIERSRNRQNRNYFYCYDKRIKKQSEDMLKITSDSYFFLYAKRGAYVVPAFEVNLSGKNSINTKEIYYRNFGSFYEEFFKCFIGDNKIASFCKEPRDLAKFSDIYNSNKVLFLKLNVPFIE